MKLKINVCTFLLLLGILTACGIRYRNPDPFYSSTGELDSIRFPLIKPYQVTYHEPNTSLAREGYWGMQLHVSPFDKEIYWYAALHDIRKIAVVNGVVMVYTPYAPSVAADAGQKVLNWFVIIPEKNIETGFDLEENFLMYIQDYGIIDVTWETPDALYQKFLHTGCLDWIPGCGK